MALLTIDLPSGVFTALRRSPEQFVADMRLASAIDGCSRGEFSQSRAADIAGMMRRAFIDELARPKVDAFAVDPADICRGSWNVADPPAVNTSPLVYLSRAGRPPLLQLPCPSPARFKPKA